MKKLLRSMAVAFLFGLCVNSNAATTSLKANFIISITRNIEWPTQMRNKPVFRVAVYGSYPLYRELIDELMGRTVYNKNIEVLNLARPQDLKLTDFHVIYIAQEACTKSNIEWIYNQTKGQGSLIMCEKEGALQDGAGVNFVYQGDKLQFEVSENNIRLQGVKVTTDLMNFATNKH